LTGPQVFFAIERILVNSKAEFHFFGMHKFPITEYKKFAELPFDKLNSLKFSVYIIDFSWNYLFVNEFVQTNLGERGKDLIGKNMWVQFKELATHPSFQTLKRNSEKGIVSNLIAISPVNGKRLNITGYPLEDCYYFSASILPDKDDLIDELRNELGKRK
jgi:hypothetical protein